MHLNTKNTFKKKEVYVGMGMCMGVCIYNQLRRKRIYYIVTRGILFCKHSCSKLKYYHKTYKAQVSRKANKSNVCLCASVKGTMLKS